MKTRIEALNWTRSKIDQSVPWVVDGATWTQCVAFARAYIAFLGYAQPRSIPNAAGLWDLEYDPNQFTKSSKPTSGALVVFSSPHVAVVESVNPNGITTIDQNAINPIFAGTKGSPVKRVTRTNLSRVRGYLVPKFQPEPQPAAGSNTHLIGKQIQLLPVDERTTFRAGTTTVAGKIKVTDNSFIYTVRGVDPKFPNRVLINSASAGGDGVALALQFVNGQVIPGWRVV